MSSFTHHQALASRFLIRNGAGLGFAGVVWPLAIIAKLTPYPRLAVGAHIQFMSNASLSLALGLLCLPSLNLITLSPLQCNVLKLALGCNWIAIGSECAGSIWGTKEILPVAAEQAGAVKGGKAWQEQVVNWSHVTSVPAAIVAFGVVVWELYQ